MVDQKNNQIAYIVSEEQKHIGDQIDAFNRHYHEENRKQYELGNSRAQLKMEKGDDSLSYDFWVNFDKDGLVSRKEKKAIIERFSYHDFNGDGYITESERTPAPSPEFSDETAKQYISEARKILSGHPQAEMAIKPMEEMVNLAARNKRLSIAENDAITNYAEILKSRQNFSALDFDKNGKLSVSEVTILDKFDAAAAAHFIENAAKAARLNNHGEEAIEKLIELTEKVAEDNVLTAAENLALAGEIKKIGIVMKDGEQEKPTAQATPDETGLKQR